MCFIAGSPGSAGSVLPTNSRRAIKIVDMRRRLKTIPAQELLTADGVGLKATLVLDYEIEDAHASISVAQDLESALYLSAQLAFRDIVVAKTLDEVMAERATYGTKLCDAANVSAKLVGVRVYRLEVKDLMLPGELKRIFGQVAEAKQASLAALERARGQAVSLRSQANSAKLLKDNPELWSLQLLDVMNSPTGNTFVIGEGARSITK